MFAWTAALALGRNSGWGIGNRCADCWRHGGRITRHHRISFVLYNPTGTQQRPSGPFSQGRPQAIHSLPWLNVTPIEHHWPSSDERH
jgi:hypothetical protein